MMGPQKTPRPKRPFFSLTAALLLPLLSATAGGCAAPADPVADDMAVACSGGGEKDAVLTQMVFARQMPPGVSPGFQLIDHVAQAGDPATCGHASLTDPDGNKGINNQLSVLMQTVDAVTKGAADTLIQESINSGMLLFGIRMLNLPASGDSPCVDLEFRLLAGKPTVGTDQRLDPNQTFDSAPGITVSTARGTLKDGVIEAGPFELTMPVRILDAQFNQVVHGARVRLKLNADGSASGLIGGAISKTEIFDHLKDYGIGPIKDLLPSVLDMVSDLVPDTVNGGCQQFSSAFVIQTKKAFINK